MWGLFNRIRRGGGLSTMMKLVLVVCAILALAWGRAHKYKMNNLYDLQLTTLNKLVPASHKIPDFELEEAVGKNVTVEGLDSQTRDGNTYLWLADDTFNNEISFRLGNLVVLVDEFSMDGTTAKVAFNVTDSKFNVRYTSSYGEEAKCTMIIEQLMITTLDSVYATSDNSKFNGKNFSKLFNKEVKAYYNKYLHGPEMFDLIQKKVVPCKLIMK